MLGGIPILVSEAIPADEIWFFKPGDCDPQPLDLPRFRCNGSVHVPMATPGRIGRCATISLDEDGNPLS
jgi:hypothetical protein